MDEIELLPLVKAYPALSRTYGEVSCIAGVTMGGAPQWIRLYPVPFRALGEDQRFAKYQPIRLRVERHSGDRRPETRRPDRDSIELVGKPIPSDGSWQQRRRFVEPLMSTSMCEVQRRQLQDGASLGVFRPSEVLDLIIERADVNREKQEIARAWAAQPSLLDHVADDERSHQIRELEQIPWSFKYRYRCSDPSCNTHRQSIIDWEIAETYRRVRGHADWQDRLRAKWIGELCAPGRDTAFFVGDQHQHPGSFLVLGVWWPERRPEQLSLGDVDNL
ncbi:MAG: hypothetical protein ACRDMH_12220 [Solirubrobacterales bacterium]